jgi:hypothetical protein
MYIYESVVNSLYKISEICTIGENTDLEQRKAGLRHRLSTMKAVFYFDC